MWTSTTSCPASRTASIGELTPGASSINGGTNRDNRVNLEGANLNDALVVNVASDISYEIVEEVQVVTSGINAEFGGVTAGVVNVITKSGGNDFSGAAYYYYSDEGLQGNNVTEEFEALGVGSGTALRRCCTARSKSLTSLCRLQSHPAQYVSGIPSAAILLSISHPIRCSTRCLANVRARISGPMIAL